MTPREVLVPSGDGETAKTVGEMFSCESVGKKLGIIKEVGTKNSPSDFVLVVFHVMYVGLQSASFGGTRCIQDVFRHM